MSRTIAVARASARPRRVPAAPSNTAEYPPATWTALPSAPRTAVSRYATGSPDAMTSASGQAAGS